MKDLRWNLQLFAEGDGGSGGDAGTADGAGTENSGESSIPAFIPEKARGTYLKAMDKVKSRQPQPSEEQEPVQKEEPATETPSRLSYTELIKSDEYKAEHQAYMDKAIGDRLKKYKGMEEQNTQMRNALDIVAGKYGLDASSASFLDDLTKQIQADDSYYEAYASQHDMSTAEAKRMLDMERRIQNMEAQRENAEKQERERQQMAALQKNAEATKAQFPGFNFEKEMQDPRFRNLVIATRGDTTAAYMACHYNDVIKSAGQVSQQMAQQAAQQAAMQTSNAIAANRSRPQENGISGNAATQQTGKSFRGMNLEEIRAYAETQRRKQGR